MPSDNYKRTIQVTATPERTFWALTEGMHEWWTTPDTPMKTVGDRSKFTFPPGNSYWVFEAKSLSPFHQVELECVEAHHLHEGQPKEIEREWLGTKLICTIKEDDGVTQVELEHIGLTPELHCYEICEAGWDFFFASSLKSFLDEGKGTPHR